MNETIEWKVRVYDRIRNKSQWLDISAHSTEAAIEATRDIITEWCQSQNEKAGEELYKTTDYTIPQVKQVTKPRAA